MNKRPVSYLQTDPRWAKADYSVPGEKTNIAESGCGPSCAAMLIETLTGKTFTPANACKWSLAHGYKALRQGTYYSYFRPQLAAHGIECKQLLSSRIINQPSHPIHEQVKEYLAQGYYVIALMGPGTWTSSGHFVLLWGWDDKVRINDPASTKDKRLNGDPATFKNEARCYWLVDARSYNNGEDDDEMTQDQFNKMMAEYEASKNPKPDSTPADWEKAGVEWATQHGIMLGDGNGDLQLHTNITRAQFCVMLKRYHEKKDSIV